MINQNVDYGTEVQKLYLEMMLADSTTFARCQSIFDHSLFDKSLQKPAKFIFDYAKEYNSLPTPEIVNASTRSSLNDLKAEPLSDDHFNWLIDSFETFIKHKGLERAIIDSAELLVTGDYGQVETIIKQAVQVGLTRDLGTDYFESPKDRLLKIKSRNGQMSTGWKTLDNVLFGGISKGELNVLAGGSGSGKSLLKANLGLNWVLAGMNVVYITLELSEELVAMRIDSMATNTSTREIFKNLDDVECKIKMMEKKSGKLQIKYLPSGKTVNDIRSYIKEYEIKTGKKVDVLIVDYLDLLMPISKKVSSDNLFLKDKYVSEELRNLAVEKNCVLLTSSQLNRTAVEEVEFDHSHIAGGISKIQTADNVIGIFTSRAMRERGRYQLQFLKTRSSSGVGQKIELDFNIDTLRVTDLPDNEEYDSAATHSGTAILNSIKQRSRIIQQEENNEESKRIKAAIESTSIRKLINRLPTEDF